MFDVWKSVLAEIEQEVSSGVFNTWFVDIILLNIDQKVVSVGVPNVFKQKQLRTKYDDLIKKTLKNNGVEFEQVKYIIHSTGNTKIKPREVERDTFKRPSEIEKIKPTLKQTRNFNTGLNERYTLDNFVIGSNNDLAVSAARNVIKKPGDKFNPFFLYGGPGLGKTHLVQAIGNELLKNNPKLKILYIPINHFYSEFINAIRDRKVDEFEKKFRSLDVLIIDDFQFIVGKDQSQQKFFDIFNDMYNLNKQIIVTSDRLPSQIKTVDERLASRLTWAGAIDLQLPNFEDKCAILKSKAEFMGVEIEDEAIEYLAENIKTNIRDLEGEFNKLLAVSELKNVSPLELINDGYINMVSNTKIKAVSPRQIVEKVAKYYDLSVKEMCGKSRVSHIKNARQVAMYILRNELGMSTKKIASEVGVSDHSTVIHGTRKIEKDLKLNFGLREQIAAIREKIYG